MIRVAVGLYELKIGSSILTRRGGTDANAPERSRKAIPRDGHVGTPAPQFSEISGKYTKIIQTHVNIYFYGTSIG